MDDPAEAGLLDAEGAEEGDDGEELEASGTDEGEDGEELEASGADEGDDAEEDGDAEAEGVYENAGEE